MNDRHAERAREIVAQLCIEDRCKFELGCGCHEAIAAALARVEREAYERAATVADDRGICAREKFWQRRDEVGRTMWASARSEALDIARAIRALALAPIANAPAYTHAPEGSRSAAPGETRTRSSAAAGGPHQR